MNDTIKRPVPNCGNVSEADGLCAHPWNLTPECHCAACPLYTQAGWCGQCPVCEEDKKNGLVPAEGAK